MVWYFALLGIVIPIAMVLFKKYRAEKNAQNQKAQFCFECNRYFPKDYRLCPKCGLSFGS